MREFVVAIVYKTMHKLTIKNRQNLFELHNKQDRFHYIIIYNNI